MGGVSKHIVKRRGHTEPFDERKVYASVYRACTSLRMTAAESELVAARVCQDVESWLEEKKEVTSTDIFHEAIKHFHTLNPDAAYLYKHFRNVS